ncbi:MAG: twin-arginine translocase TatA/TatE family subunit [Chlamydiales bacterium]|nr:twin-arginine translocase TatA/TatE family subunit [Chlamydiales bacterium]
MIGGWEIILTLLVVLLLFGGKKLPELAKSLGQGIREFKKASREVEKEFQSPSEEDSKDIIEGKNSSKALHSNELK